MFHLDPDFHSFLVLPLTNHIFVIAHLEGTKGLCLGYKALIGRAKSTATKFTGLSNEGNFTAIGAHLLDANKASVLCCYHAPGSPRRPIHHHCLAVCSTYYLALREVQNLSSGTSPLCIQSLTRPFTISFLSTH